MRPRDGVGCQNRRPFIFQCVFYILGRRHIEPNDHMSQEGKCLLCLYALCPNKNMPVYSSGISFNLISLMDVARIVWITHHWIYTLQPKTCLNFVHSQNSIFRFDIMDNISQSFSVLTYAIIYILIHQMILLFYLLKCSFFFQVLLY